MLGAAFYLKTIRIGVGHSLRLILRIDDVIGKWLGTVIQGARPAHQTKNGGGTLEDTCKSSHMPSSAAEMLVHFTINDTIAAYKIYRWVADP